MADPAATKQKLKDDLKKTIKANRDAFEGSYAEELKALQGLSQAEADAMLPKGADPKVYDQLIEVVKDASRRNIANAELKDRITALGEGAVAIAKAVAPLATLFA